MITEPTLFILGAGASKPYGFPTGIELRKEIIKKFYKEYNNLLSQTDIIADYRQEMLEEVKIFITPFANSPTSIDKFLAFNTGHQKCGKFAIAYFIRQCEIRSKFLEEIDSQEDWYGYLFYRMIAELKDPLNFEKFRENKVAFLPFNYDRSLEFFLHRSFLNTFQQSYNKF